MSRKIRKGDFLQVHVVVPTRGAGGTAERAGLHRNYVGGIERGERNVALENIVKLAGALSVCTRDLFDSLP